MIDFYEVLGINKDASQDEIKKAFHRLAKQHHPDITGNNNTDIEHFKKITESYQTLSDQDRRRHYDIKRIVQITDESPKSNVKEAVDFAFQGFSDFLNELLFKEGDHENNRSPIQGKNIETDLSISFEESYLGIKKNLKYQAPRICSECKAKGWPPKHPPQKCPECKGLKVKHAKGPIPFKRACKRCNGKGYVQTHSCNRCHGKLLRNEKESLSVAIPAGIEDKTRLCLTKKGGSGLHNGEPGDLYIRINIDTSIHFTRKEQDIYFSSPITISEIMLGCEIHVPLPQENIKIKIPPATDLKKSFRVKNKGLSSLENESKGHLYITLQLVTPPHIPESAIPLIKKLTKLMPGF